ncbi:MAG: DUF3050 domain-containing protein [Gammaproteobacteria bacterium]|nr:MAG: DUF3050 domain-containing protein [Gammaproteobacteria bacterium]
MAISKHIIASFQEQLERHPVYGAINSIGALRVFMEHHIYSVWDFMSLIKYLQHLVAPAAWPWLPGGDSDVRRFINELVLEEESDMLPGEDQKAASHFELYCRAMEEIGASPKAVLDYLELIKTGGIDRALSQANIPEPSREFNRRTFDFIQSGKPHTVAAALALGREHIIPGMFRSFLRDMAVTEQQAPIFHFYLNRHIHLDEDFHAPLSLRLLDALCDNDPVKEQEAVDAAHHAVAARIEFWNGVHEAIKKIS